MLDAGSVPVHYGTYKHPKSQYHDHPAQGERYSHWPQAAPAAGSSFLKTAGNKAG